MQFTSVCEKRRKTRNQKFTAAKNILTKTKFKFLGNLIIGKQSIPYKEAKNLRVNNN